MLAVLTALGGLNLFQSIKNKLTTDDQTYTYEATAVASTQEARTERVKIRVERSENRVQAVALSSSDSAEEVMIEESFDVREGQTLFIDVQHADVSIVTGNRNSAEVEVRLDSRRMDRARERFEEMNWEVYEDGDRIVVTSEQVNGRKRWNNVDMNVDVIIHIPAEFDADIETSHGDVVMGDLMGELRLLTSHGDVELDAVEGNSIWVKSSHGDISGDALTAENIEIRTSHADIDFGEINAEEFDATTSHADIDVGSLSARTRLQTSHGDIDVELMRAASVELETTHGDVHVTMPRSAKMDLDLRGAEVEISSSLDVNGRMSEDYVRGQLNGGGELLRARTSHGDITIR